MHRDSMISVASFDSLPEEGEPQGSPVSAIIRSPHTPKSGNVRPTSAESPRRRRRRDVQAKPIDGARESKRRKVIEEFYETERAYVDDRSHLTSVFSNFIDIWNLHRSFFSSLSTLLTASHAPLSASGQLPEPPPPLSSILLSHFPYLSLYNPFVTAFPSTISTLAELITPPSTNHPNPQYNSAFASFLSTQETDPRCGKLKLRDWLLTIVQRCPRYLLLLKDLIGCTNPDDQEHRRLIAAHALVSKITLSLNTSLHTHAQTLALLSLQRSTPNLPFQLIAPGRALLRRGALLQIERSQPQEREFLLFSDCLIWLANEEVERAWKGDWGIGRSGWSGGYGVSIIGSSGPVDTPVSAASSPSQRPQMLRSRSKSEAELSLLKANAEGSTKADGSPPPSTPSTPSKQVGRGAMRKSYHPPSNLIRRNASNGGDERWIYKGRAELVDLEVVVTPPREEGEERRFEILSPEGSFVLYTATPDERDEWCTSIRQAKAQLLVSLNVTHPNSTLTSSSSTNHLRRSLQALPFPPSDDRIATIRDTGNDAKRSKGKGRGIEPVERRRKVEHWVPAIWIPDEKTGGCMRCGRSFGWRRRRHHCRLCGRRPLTQTFFISDPNAKGDSSKPARACDACYETVFPLIDPPTEGDEGRKDNDTLTSLNNLPSWLSMPSLPVNINSTPRALMATEREPSSPNALLHDLPDLASGEMRGRVKLKHTHSTRPRSYHQLLEDFEQNEYLRFDALDVPVEEGGGESEDGEGVFGLERESSYASSNGHSASPSSPRRENTARRNKRFSLPAVALHTASVTARTSAVFDYPLTGGPEEGFAGGAKPNNRFSLVLGGSRHVAGGNRTQSRATKSPAMEGTPVTKSIVVGRLNELLGRKRE
ncbi:hypothetical protein H0H81_005245 [Sphagnurus paluster]|uniref:Uncharacterized protein n=1 Tax=Sphagnurus paluster TaxID=117069 RepID=A0A9P7FRL0_9AGAR|nr:hypothetical protein H0H81_005245 [Sphagnurus paluster]